MQLTQSTMVAFSVVASFATSVFAAQAPAARPAGGERFEVTSIKAVRPTLVNTIDALKKGDTDKAKDAFEAYDTAWNGIEVYINTRDRDMYNELEKNYQSKIEEGLNAPKPDVGGAALERAGDAREIRSGDRDGREGVAPQPAVRRHRPGADRTIAAPEHQPCDEGRERHQGAESVRGVPGQLARDQGVRQNAVGEAYDTVEKGHRRPRRRTEGPTADPPIRWPALVNGMMGKINAVAFQLTTEARK